MRKYSVLTRMLLIALFLLAACTSTPQQESMTPGNVLDLSNWILAIPEGNDSGEPSEMGGGELRTYSSDYFQLNQAKDGVVFRVQAGDFVQDGSLFPRTELREMAPRDIGQQDQDRAFWSNDDASTYSMTIREAITRLPEVHPSIVAGQLHDADNYVALIRLDDRHLYVKSNGKNVGTLDESYELGTPFVVEIKSTQGRVEVLYNGERKAQFDYACEGCYFKAGAYLQTNDDADYGDKPDAVGEVVINELSVSHR